MARPLRIEYPNAWYHVMNRGLRREDIFFNPEDRDSFLSLLDDIHNKYHVQVHAYCLMTNHYHLMLHTPLPNLQKAMRHLGSVYTQRINRAYGRDGPLFRGRYKAKIIETETYLTRLSRYIHLNPVEAKIVAMPEDYQWSSCSAFLQQEKAPQWLFRDETMSYFEQENLAQTIENYRYFLQEGIDSDIAEKISSKSSCPILGSDQFILSMVEKLKKTDLEEIPEQKPLIQLLRPSLPTIENITNNYFNIDQVELGARGKKPGNFPRQLAIYLAAQHTDHSHQEIADFFGDTSRYGVSKTYRRMKNCSEKNADIKRIIQKIEQIM